MIAERDLFADVRAALATSSSSEGDIAVLYCAVARAMLARARDELRQLAELLRAREAELARRETPKAQLELKGW